MKQKEFFNLEDIIYQIKPQRIKYGLSLAEISSMLKIPESMLKKIEENDLSMIAKNFFFYKHVIAYAKLLDIDTTKLKTPKLNYLYSKNNYNYNKDFIPSNLQIIIALIIILVLL